MPETTLQTPPPSPLTSFSEDEIMFRDNIRQFADEKVRPLVKEMDEKGVFDKDLIHQFFQLGLMGIEIPEQYGGGGGKFFEAILAVEEMSRVDASAGVIVDVQNTLVNNAFLRWGTEEQRKQYLPRMAADTCGAYALSEAGRLRCFRAANPGSRCQGQRLFSERAQALDHQWQGGGSVRAVRHGRSSRGIQGNYCLHHRKEFPWLHRG